MAGFRVVEMSGITTSAAVSLTLIQASLESVVRVSLQVP